MTDGSASRPVACDPRQVRARFSRAAATYDAAARHQDRAARELCRRLPANFHPRHVLEWGCGTGRLTERLARRDPGARIVALDIAPGMVRQARKRLAGHPGVRVIEADAESFVPAAPVDLLISNCAVQWFRDWDATAHRCRDWVAPGGFLSLAVPLDGTLAEFWDSLRAAGATPAGALPMRDPETYCIPFGPPDWCDRRLRVRRLVEHYDNARAVLRALSHLGATAAVPGAARLAPGVLRRALAVYQRRHADAGGRVPCTYRLLFLRVRRDAPAAGGEREA